MLAGDSTRELREILLELDADLARQEAAIRAGRERLAALLSEEAPSPDGAVSPRMAEFLRASNPCATPRSRRPTPPPRRPARCPAPTTRSPRRSLFSLDVPAELIAAAWIDRRYDEKGLVRLSDGELALAVSSQTNIVVDLREPMEVPRPRRPWMTARPAATVRRVRFFADDPAAALRAVAALTTVAAGERAP
ncbi:hypothetical protein [Microbispora sitophila]|uniref:hypothetical protein n=1 Tax=Microbispora sitophila TaxID=2771537 RepID=UPI001D017A3B|nr:hypothetical protein [Microbispora sitophila]